MRSQSSARIHNRSTDRRRNTGLRSNRSGGMLYRNADDRDAANTADRRGSVLGPRLTCGALVAQSSYRLDRLKLDRQGVRHQAQARLMTATSKVLS